MEVLTRREYNPRNFIDNAEDSYLDLNMFDLSWGQIKILSYKNLEDIKKSWQDVTDSQCELEIGKRKFLLPAALRPIAGQIEEAKEILNYQDDWDDEGGQSTDEETLMRVAAFVLEYAQFLYDQHKLILGTPYIDIMTDGGISVYWETEKAQLLIIFKKISAQLAYYYAESKQSKVPFKSAIEPGQPVDEILTTWMKMYLT